MSRGSEWIPLDKYLAQEFKSIKREFSMIEAMFSLSLDIDNGKQGSISGYSSLWGWSRNKVRRFVDGVIGIKGHIKDSKRTVKGQAIHFIDKALWNKKDSKRTVKGHKEDTTTNPIILNPSLKEIYKESCTRLILKINELGNKNFRVIQTNFDFIIPRLKEGFTEENCLTVINNKNLDPNFSNQYFKPETIFRKSKFEGYLNEDPKQYKKFGTGGLNGSSENFTRKDTRKPVIPERLPKYG